jgi:hypothetical protein
MIGNNDFFVANSPFCYYKKNLSPESGIWDTILTWTQNQLCRTAKDLAPILKGPFRDQIHMVAKSPDHNMQFQLAW